MSSHLSYWLLTHWPSAHGATFLDYKNKSTRLYSLYFIWVWHQNNICQTLVLCQKNESHFKYVFFWFMLNVMILWKVLFISVFISIFETFYSGALKNIYPKILIKKKIDFRLLFFWFVIKFFKFFGIENLIDILHITILIIWAKKKN